MNVLVYSGPEILQTSFNHTLSSLRSILVPNYTVQAITQQALTSQPWQKSCALLVLPRTRQRFISPSSKHIKEFVEAGGSYLMLGTGASITSRSGFDSTVLSFSSEMPEKPLKFYDNFNNCYITIEEVASGSETKERAITLQCSDGTKVDGIYDSGEADFSGFEDLKGVSVLAKYTIGLSPTIAGLTMEVNKGKISLWGPGIEYPLKEEPMSSIIASSLNFSSEDIDKFDTTRKTLIVATLTKLGLEVPQATDKKATISRPLPQFLTSTPVKSTIVSQITDAIAAPQTGSQLSSLKDSNDEFYFHSLQESSDLINESRNSSKSPSDPSTWQPKHIIICRDGALPSPSLTPLFNLDLFYKSLSSARTQEGLLSSPDSWGIGEALLYGEAVTSTQTMLDKNPHLLSNLPAPLLSLASYQLAGRGRGSNVWLSPSGCLQFSILLRVSLSDFPGNKLVFLQYLFALAVVEACRDETVLGPKAGDKIRLKWPNDIYASVGMGRDDYRKIGGVLVNTSFSGGKVDIVIGCGLNVLNLPPITSLTQLHSSTRESLSMERTAAMIMAKFESMWTIFVKERGSFQSFNDLYLKRWLHSDQLVTLTTTTPHTAVRIVGITSDYGLLRTIPERSGMSRFSGRDEDYIDLQPDGNSFDLMANLIKSKS
ncbi:Biotin--protein ligase [Psilocybe cubensis]|uniref:Biotin--protein ligase n=2 Tax=Psilocybe cubensis TaxID=181762 RepID=A0ACB8GG59_PSICU|nr:Biotin--protein ligase [Psilocybe cubensis]KAH9474636.1 Biotin--protein ligase [Psilocybe cubensis]